MYHKRRAVMTISLRLNEEDTMLFKKYAELNGITISELVRRSVIKHTEDEYDLKAYEESMAEFKANKQIKKIDKHTAPLITAWSRKT